MISLPKLSPPEKIDSFRRRRHIVSLYFAVSFHRLSVRSFLCVNPTGDEAKRPVCVCLTHLFHSNKRGEWKYQQYFQQVPPPPAPPHREQRCWELHILPERHSTPNAHGAVKARAQPKGQQMSRLRTTHSTGCARPCFVLRRTLA